MAEALLAALICGAVSAGLCLFSPRVIAALAEPEGAEDKPAYADLAKVDKLALRLAVAAGLLGLALGARLGLVPDLTWWSVLTPVFVTLAWIDWRTRYLPTRIIAPTYVVLLALILINAVLPWGDGLEGLKHAALGWLGIGGLYLLLWLVYPRGIGYGDVRLSGLLGLSLGHLGFTESLVGGYAGFLLGAIGGVVLARMKRTKGRHFPFGPFMVAGAFLAVLAGAEIGALLGY